MIKESIFFQVWLFFVGIFKKYETSVFYNFVIKTANSFKKIYCKSMFYNYFSTPSNVYEKYETSVFYNLKENSLKRIVSAAEWVISKCDESLICNNIKTSFVSKFFRFENLLIAFILFIMITPHEVWNNLYGVLGAAGLMILYFFSLAKRGGEIKFRQSVWLVLFLIATLGAMFITPSLKEGIRVALFFFTSVIFMVMISDGISSEKVLKNAVYCLIFSLFIGCIYGIYQGIMKISAENLLTDIANNKGMPGRITAMFDNPNNFAEIIVLLSPFSVAMFLSSNKKSVKFIMLISFSVNVLALLMTYTRGCYISFAISMFVFLLMYDYRLLIPVAVLAFFMLPFVPTSVINRIISIGSRQDTSISFRYYLWDGVVKLIRSEGITGVGLGPEAFKAAYLPFASRFALTAPHSHMLYLELIIETGIMGALSFFAFMVSSLRKGFAIFNKTDKTLRSIIIAAISAFIGISLSAATEYIWFYPRVMFVFWIVLGILLCAVKLSKKADN